MYFPMHFAPVCAHQNSRFYAFALPWLYAAARQISTSKSHRDRRVGGRRQRQARWHPWC